jgi:hypothetical protein
VDQLYKFKLEGDPTIKILLNAGLGRFGIKLDPTISKIVSSDEAKDILIKYRVFNNLPLFSTDSKGQIEFIKYDPYSLKKMDDITAEDADKFIEDDFIPLLNIDQSLPLTIAVNSEARIL